MKERFEWVQSWCDEAPSNDLPRVLLIGDSITRQYDDMFAAHGSWIPEYK